MLSKRWQLSELESSIRISVGQVTKEKIQSKTIKKYLNFALQDIAQQLNGAAAPDYGNTWNISDSGSSETNTIVTGASYTDATKTVQKTGHNLTSTSVGQRISLWNGTISAVIAEIASITDVNNFVISKAFGGDIAGTVSYAVFSAHTSPNVDLSALDPPIDKVVKIKDSINGLLTPLGDADIEAENITDFEDGVFWNKFGETIYLKIGDNVPAWGTLTLFGYRQPYLLNATTDYIDIKDEYVPLVLAKATNYILVILKETAPESLTALIASETQKIRQANQEENAIIKQRATDRSN